MRALALVATLFGIIAGCLVATAALAAGKYDGSTPFICAAGSVHECEAAGQCQRRLAERVNLPLLFRVDVNAMKVHNLEADKGRSSAIRSVEHPNGKLMVSGADGERGWIVLVNEQTGRMSAVVSGDSEGFVVFGQCGLP